MMKLGRGGSMFVASLLLAAAPLSGAGAEEKTVQKPPLATEPMPVQGEGQAAVGNAVTGSAPAPNTSSTIDDSQEQQGVLLKPGESADDMKAASGAKPK